MTFQVNIFFSLSPTCLRPILTPGSVSLTLALLSSLGTAPLFATHQLLHRRLLQLPVSLCESRTHLPWMTMRSFLSLRLLGEIQHTPLAAAAAAAAAFRHGILYSHQAC